MQRSVLVPSCPGTCCRRGVTVDLGHLGGGGTPLGGGGTPGRDHPPPRTAPLSMPHSQRHPALRPAPPGSPGCSDRSRLAVGAPSDGPRALSWPRARARPPFSDSWRVIMRPLSGAFPPSPGQAAARTRGWGQDRTRRRHSRGVRARPRVSPSTFSSEALNAPWGHRRFCAGLASSFLNSEVPSWEVSIVFTTEKGARSNWRRAPSFPGAVSWRWGDGQRGSSPPSIGRQPVQRARAGPDGRPQEPQNPTAWCALAPRGAAPLAASGPPRCHGVPSLSRVAPPPGVGSNSGPTRCPLAAPDCDVTRAAGPLPRVLSKEPTTSPRATAAATSSHAPTSAILWTGRLHVLCRPVPHDSRVGQGKGPTWTPNSGLTVQRASVPKRSGTAALSTETSVSCGR